MRPKGKKKEKPPKEKFEPDSYCYALLLKMMCIEARCLFSCNRKSILEWFYQSYLNQGKDTSASLTEDRIEKAYRAKETFRKTLYSTEGDPKPITEAFLGTITNKLGFFGTYATWKDFTEAYERDFKKYAQERMDIYIAYAIELNKASGKPELPEVFFATAYTVQLFRDKIIAGDIYTLDRRVVSANRYRVFLKAVPVDFALCSNLERFPTNNPRMIIHEKANLFKINPDLFYIGVSSNGEVSDSISIIPIQEIFLRVIQYSPSGSTRLLPQFIYGPESYQYVKELIVIISSCTKEAFPFQVISIVKTMFGEYYNPEMIIYMASDSELHRQFIRTYLLQPTGIRSEYKLLHHVVKNGVKKLAIEQISYELFACSISHLFDLCQIDH